MKYMKGIKKWENIKNFNFSLVVFGYEWKSRGMENFRNEIIYLFFIWLRRKMR